MRGMALTSIVLLALSGSLAASEYEEFFEKRVRPMLHEQCEKCHGAEKQKGGLRVDSRVALLKGGDSGPAIVAGNADGSLLLKAVRHLDPDLKMPPPKEGPKLSDAVIGDLAAWVKAGAVFPAASAGVVAKHWAFEPVSNPQVPLPFSDDVKTSVDAFMLAKLRAAGVKTAPVADKRTLIRRATYDLTGLPPTPEEVDAFIADSSPDAFAKLVERLLASPAYGERWGRKWLDVVRYADSAGDNSDYPAPYAWRYRNYVINAFNQDMPYDQFLREQLAGDLIAKGMPTEKAAEHIVATGYLAIARRFGGSKDDRDFYLSIEDTIDTVGKSVVGLTIACARCHNHKYDPITARDFYGLYGIFASTRFSFPGNEEAQRPRDLVQISGNAAELKAFETEFAKLDAEVKRVQTELNEKRKAFAASVPVKLASGDIDNGGKQDFGVGDLAEPESLVRMKAGEMLQLTINPKKDYGADSTQLEFEIAESGGTHTWSLSRDVIEHFADPHDDSRFGAWCLLDAAASAPALFTRLERDAGKQAGLHVRRGLAEFPLVEAYTQTTPIKIVNATLAPRSIIVHPSPKGEVAVAWECPADGAFTIKGRVIDIDPGGGDGVAWRLERRPGISAALNAALEVTKLRNAAEKKRDELAAKKPIADMAYAVAEGKPANARVHKRGEPKDLGDEVPRKNIDLFGGQPIGDPASSGRLDLARWFTDAKNPLTARVMANRIWLGHFGRGIVATPNDFGTRGAPPTHPELLDHLATKFIESGWSIKAMHRLIMLSAAYQRSSARAADGAPSADYARFERRRLDAEQIRDTLLQLSGELDRVPGAGHPFPAENTWGFTQHNPFKAVYDSQKRSVYLMTQRIQRQPFLALFDGADTNMSTPVRNISTVPTQALFFLNNPFFHARSEALAKRMLSLSDDSQRIAFAYRLCLQRAPTEVEIKRATNLVAAYQAELASGAATASQSLEQRTLASWSAFARLLLGSNELLYLD